MPTGAKSLFPILFIAVCLGTALRLQHIETRSISHPEMFVPGIPLPEGISTPQPRMDLFTTVKSTLNSDTHPPAYYVIMWFITKVFGSSIWAIRLPSVVFGVLSIALVFWLAALLGRPVIGCVVACLLSVNGFHIFWSEIARMYALICFLGLLSTNLLLLASRTTKPMVEAGYAVVVLIGLSSHVFFWPFFGAQMAWVLLNCGGHKNPPPRIWKIQVLVLVLGSPLLAFAAYQSGNRVAVLGANALLFAREFIGFGFLLSGTDSSPLWPVARIVFLLLSITLLIAGLRSLRALTQPACVAGGGPSSKAWFGAALLAVIAILTHIVFAGRFVHPPLETLKLTKAMTILPPFFALFGVVANRVWHRIPSYDLPRALTGGHGLIVLLMTLPFALLGLYSMLLRPAFVERGLIILVPYLLLVVAAGIVNICRRPLLAIPLIAMLGVVHAYSVIDYGNRSVDPLDHRLFTSRFKPLVEPGDLIFLRRGWATTPVLFYLPANHYRLFADGFDRVCKQNPGARVWTLLFYGQRHRAEREMEEALKDYRVITAIEVPFGRAVLYVRTVRHERLP